MSQAQSPKRPVTKGLQIGERVKQINSRLEDLEKTVGEMIIERASNALLAPEHYQDLVTHHAALLHQYQDFCLASLHPVAPEYCKQLVISLHIPARVWRIGIRGLVELLKSRLPESFEFLQWFTYEAYSGLVGLLQVAPALAGTWEKFLGDLSRYRMAIENPSEKEEWRQVSRQWYLKCTSRSPESGRLYHHLGILARPDSLHQLLYFSKSLAVPIPFRAARESILTLVDPAFRPTWSTDDVLATFVKCHAILFMQKELDIFRYTLCKFVNELDGYITQLDKRYSKKAFAIAIANCIALVGFSSETNPLNKAIAATSRTKVSVQRNDSDTGQPSHIDACLFEHELDLFIYTVNAHLDRVGDLNVLGFIHVTLVFIRHIAILGCIQYIESRFPWTRLIATLNNLLVKAKPRNFNVIEGDKVPQWPREEELIVRAQELKPDNQVFRPLPEDWALRGLEFADRYLEQDWFSIPNCEDEEHYLETESMRVQDRPWRVLWLGVQIAKIGQGQWIVYDDVKKRFTTK